MKEEIRRLENEKAERRARKKIKKELDELTKSPKRNINSSKKDKYKNVNTLSREHRYDRQQDRQQQKVNTEKNPLEYYSSFSKKPVDFRKLYLPSDSENYSSSEISSSSSDDFPSPTTPKKKREKNKRHVHEDNNHDDLFGKVKDLQRRLYEMEIQNRKLKAQNKR
jgi:hypothetical protein